MRGRSKARALQEATLRQAVMAMALTPSSRTHGVHIRFLCPEEQKRKDMALAGNLWSRQGTRAADTLESPRTLKGASEVQLLSQQTGTLVYMGC